MWTLLALQSSLTYLHWGSLSSQASSDIVGVFTFDVDLRAALLNSSSEACRRRRKRERALGGNFSGRRKKWSKHEKFRGWGKQSICRILDLVPAKRVPWAISDVPVGPNIPRWSLDCHKHAVYFIRQLNVLVPSWGACESPFIARIPVYQLIFF
jgi:hypothetical protein